MVTICKKCKHHRDWTPEAYGFYTVIRDFCCAPVKEVSFVSGRPLWDIVDCRKKNEGKCPDFKLKPEPRQLATVVLWVVLWVGVKMPEPVKPESVKSVKPVKKQSLWSSLSWLVLVGFAIAGCVLSADMIVDFLMGILK